MTLLSCNGVRTVVAFQGTKQAFAGNLFICFIARVFMQMLQQELNIDFAYIENLTCLLPCVIHYKKPIDIFISYPPHTYQGTFQIFSNQLNIYTNTPA